MFINIVTLKLNRFLVFANIALIDVRKGFHTMSENPIAVIRGVESESES